MANGAPQAPRAIGVQDGTERSSRGCLQVLVRPTDCHGYLSCNWETACGVTPPVGFACPLVPISAAPIMLSITPAQRSEETCSCRKMAPAAVATTKPSPVRGHKKLMSAWVIRTTKQAKK